ncbi:MAG TPA: hypothetical protein VF702_07435 [Allosphingosinicella sp.]|jgi:YD repeat-containing protein
MKARTQIVAAILLASAGAALASETIRYTYDARGRLVKVERTDAATNTVKTVTEYSHDKADNRTKRETKSGQ